MPNIYPTDDKVWMLLADSIRMETANKLTIIGYLGEGDLNLLSPVTFPAAIPLGALFVLRDGEGTFKGRFQILDTRNNSIVDVPLASDVVKLRGQPNNVIIAISALVITTLGDYTFILYLDQAQYRRVVHIKSL
jgi:hypothetical protein